jgi:hypothetical protein
MDSHREAWRQLLGRAAARDPAFYLTGRNMHLFQFFFLFFFLLAKTSRTKDASLMLESADNSMLAMTSSSLLADDSMSAMVVFVGSKKKKKETRKIQGICFCNSIYKMQNKSSSFLSFFYFHL